jgi:hypothetical protein
MMELHNEIARQEMRCEQLILHVRQNRAAPEANVERMHLLALLEDLAKLKAERQRRVDMIEFNQAA